ncbi:tyrosine-type recombinase/integrase [Azospirillum argentinense]
MRRTQAVRWQLQYVDAEGVRRYRNFGTKAEAQKHETKVRGELVDGTHTPDSTSITVTEAGDLWLKSCEADGLQAVTLKGYREYLNLHIKPTLGTTKLSRLTRPMVETFKDEMVKKRSRVLARKVVSALGAILKDAMRRGLLAQNVAAGVRVEERRAEDYDDEDRIDDIDRIPAPEEVGQMLRKAEEMWPLIMEVEGDDGELVRRPIPWHPLLMVAAFTGLRISEVLGLTWQNIDLRAGLVKVRRRVDFKRGLGPVKSRMGKREVPIPAAAIRVLKEWKMACPPTDLDLVFPFWDKQPMHYNVARKQCMVPVQVACGWSKARPAIEAKDGKKRRIPLPEVRYGFHDLRHFAASMFIEMGWNAKRIQAVMGHSTIQMTFDLYGHLFARRENNVDAMSAFESSVFGRGGR